MTKEVFIALIQKDIRELDMIAQGLYETETLSPAIIKLASSKAQEVVTNLQKLAEIKVEEPTIEQEEVKEVEEVKEEIIATAEQKSVEKVTVTTINTPTETKIESLSKSKDDSFANSLANKKISDIKQAINIADRFRFQRELFANSAEKMNETLSHLNTCTGIEETTQYLSANFDWKAENETAEDFLNLVKRLFV